MAKLIQHHADSREKKPFCFLDLPRDIRYMVFDELVPKKIRLRKRYTGVGGSSAIASIFKLLLLNKQSREEILNYIRYRNPIFSLLMQDAHSFPLPLEVRRLELLAVELDRESMFRSNNPTFECLPTRRIGKAIEKFGQCWTNHRIEELILHFFMAPHTEYRRVPYGSTLVSVLAPLGHFNEVQALYSLKNIWWRKQQIQCEKAFKGIAETLPLSLKRQSSGDSS
jgi:hypothetical protein